MTFRLVLKSSARNWSLLLTAALCTAIAPAQPLSYTISTVAGGAPAFDFAEGKPATSFLIGFAQPAVDRQGNFYFSLGNRVVQVGPDGTAKTYAGTGLAGFGGDSGPGTSALLNGPGALLLDAQGRLIIFDEGNNRVRRVELNGTITTIAGTGLMPPSSGDGEGGPATAARVHAIFGAFDNQGNLFILDEPGDYSPNVRRIDTAGRIATVARGVGVYPSGIASDGTNIYLADGNPVVNHVSRMAPGGTFAPVTGSQVGFGGDGGPASKASFQYLGGIAIDSAGNLYIVDSSNQRIRTVRNSSAATVASGQGVISTSAGTGAIGFGAEGAPALTSALSFPSTIAADAADNIYFSDNGSGRFRRFRLNGAIQTVAGLSLTDPLGDGGPATQSGLVSPAALFRNSTGNLLIADGARLRQITPNGLIGTLAGLGVQGDSGDNGPALQALFRGPASAVQDSTGNTYVLDDNALRKIGPDGTISRIIGFAGATQDEGPAAKIGLSNVDALAIDTQNNIYIGDQIAVRKLTPAGTVTRMVGVGGYTQAPLSSGDPRATSLAGARGLTFDGSGNLYVADSFNHRILKVTPAGQFSTVAGTVGKSGFSGDGGPAAQALLDVPAGLAFDPWGNLYFADVQNHRVRKIAPDGTISTIGGSANAGAIPDGGPAIGGQLSPSFFTCVVTDPAGNVLTVDGNRVRQLTGDKLRVQGVLHAAIQDSGPVAAGLRILVRGTELIPPGTAAASLQVFFDGQPAGFMSQDGSQITTVVPASVAGNPSTALQVAINGAGTNTLTLPVVAARPGILSIQNDDGTANAASNPANADSTITVSLTGDGGADPSLISIVIGGMPTNFLAGNAADNTGIRLVQVQLPDGISSGDPIVVSVGGAASPSVQVW